MSDIESRTLPSFLSFFWSMKRGLYHLKLFFILLSERDETSLCVLEGFLCLLGFDPKVLICGRWSRMELKNHRPSYSPLTCKNILMGWLRIGCRCSLWMETYILLGLDMDTGYTIRLKKTAGFISSFSSSIKSTSSTTTHY